LIGGRLGAANARRTLTPLAPACARHAIMIHNRPKFTQPRVKTHWELGGAQRPGVLGTARRRLRRRASSKNHEVSARRVARLAARPRAAPPTTRDQSARRVARQCDRPPLDATLPMIIPQSLAWSRPRYLVQGSGGPRPAESRRRDAKFFPMAIGRRILFAIPGEQRARGLRW